MKELVILNDWMTSPEISFFSKITADDDSNIFHTHDFYEIFYILEGEISHNLNGSVTTLSRGNIVFLNRDDVHAFSREPGNTCKHRDIIIRTDFFEEVCKFIGQEFYDAYLHNALPKVVMLPFDQIKQFEVRIQNALLLPESAGANRKSTYKILLVSLLGCLLEKVTEQENTNYPTWFNELLTRFHMIDFLKSGLDDILEPFHFNRSYLCRTFQKYMNCTMTDYLNNIRLEQAAFQLQYTDSTIITICNSVGFSSVSYFNKVFKEKYHVSPHTFRKQQKDTLRRHSTEGESLLVE